MSITLAKRILCAAIVNQATRFQGVMNPTGKFRFQEVMGSVKIWVPQLIRRGKTQLSIQIYKKSTCLKLLLLEKMLNFPSELENYRQDVAGTD